MKKTTFIIPLALILMLTIILDIYCHIPINTDSTDLYPSPISVVLILLVSAIPTLTILRYAKPVFDSYIEDQQEKKDVLTTLARIDKRLHWVDVGFELQFEILHTLLSASDLTEEKKNEVRDRIANLIMQRMPTDNPEYLAYFHLKAYLWNWVLTYNEKP